MDIRVKICGITKPDQAQAIAQLGATALGFICVVQSPRYISPQQIRTIVEQLPLQPTTGLPVDRIGVFVDVSLEQICQTVGIAQLNGVQLHGNESLQFCRQLQRSLPQVEIIKALRLRGPEALDSARLYAGVVNTLLLDAYHPQMLGGTGQTLNWSTLKKFRPICPWFLAGGLTPANILQALQQVQPSGIDLSSGLERAPGDKDLTLVRQLFQQLQSFSLT